MAKKKEMNRTAGTARRLTGRSEGIATKLKYGAPLTGSASGVKSISLKDAGEALTQGIVTLGKKGLKVAPEGLAMALPVGKVLKAAKVFRAAGNIGKADALTARVVAKAAGGSRAAVRGQREQKVIAFMRPEWPGIFNGSTTLGALKGSTGVRSAGTKARGISESVFPRVKFGSNPVAEGTLNIVDTRRMNPAQAKAALEGGVSQTAKIARRIPGKEKPVRGATARLLKGRGK